MSMHLNHDDTMTCTHSVAECVTAIAAESHLRGADYVLVAWDDRETHVAVRVVPYPRADDGTAVTYAMRDHDPFQSGEHATMPAWYVGRQLARVLGA